MPSSNFRGHGKVIYVDANKINKALNIEKLLMGAMKIRGGVLGKKPKNMILLITAEPNINIDRLAYKIIQILGKDWSEFFGK